MTKRLFVALLALTFCSTAGADLYVNIGTSGGSWPSAPYIITPDQTSDVPDWMPSTFPTFCVERYVTFSPSVGYYRATVDDQIWYGSGGDDLPDALEDNVKKIYAAYLNTALDDISVPVGQQIGNVIQESVWGAQGYSYSINGEIAGIIGDADAIAGWNNVKVLNLWSGDAYAGAGDVQSQLVMTPVPGAVLLGMLGLSVVGVKLRKHA